MSLYVTQGGGLQRINSHLLDDGAPESLRFLGVWNCLMQLGGDMCCVSDQSIRLIRIKSNQMAAWQMLSSLLYNWRRVSRVGQEQNVLHTTQHCGRFACFFLNFLFVSVILCPGSPQYPSRPLFVLLPGASTEPTGSWGSTPRFLGMCHVRSCGNALVPSFKNLLGLSLRSREKVVSSQKFLPLNLCVLLGMHPSKTQKEACAMQLGAINQ